LNVGVSFNFYGKMRDGLRRGVICRKIMDDAETTEDEARASVLKLTGQTTANLTACFWQDGASPKEPGKYMLVG